ncbi:conserved hypothetical protein [Capnocytophaga canis]|uniref:Radical SAM domain protein n=4 Tax=Capnocytophaga TaxID=1016 RepID=A0A0B7IWD3_9FLAO|nr:conserved hypothetical protein [Capnocytophaga canis]
MRFYGFEAREILTPQNPFLDLEIDPKLAWALRNPQLFPVNLQTAAYEMILRVPGIGRTSAYKIVNSRRFQTITMEHLKKMGVAVNRAKFFIDLAEKNPFLKYLDQLELRQLVISSMKSKYKNHFSQQLSLF